MAIKFFHVQENVLLAMGFKKEITDDKNSPSDEINTLRLIEYTKRINSEVSVEITYLLTTVDEKNYTFVSSVIELHLDNEFCTVPVHQLSDLNNLILILTGNE